MGASKIDVWRVNPIWLFDLTVFIFLGFFIFVGEIFFLFFGILVLRRQRSEVVLALF